MEPKHLNRLAIAAVVSLIAAGLVHSSYNDFSDDTISGEKLFPSLGEQAANVGQITLGQGEKKLSFKKSEDGKQWSIVERSGYPVDAKKVRKLVVSLAKAELIQRKTRDEKRFAQLELEEPDGKDAKSKLIRLADSGGKTVAEIVVGKRRHGAFGTSKSGTYLRKPGDNQTWLASLDIEAPLDVSDWVQPVFFKIDDKAMKSLVVSEGDKTVYKLDAGDDKDGALKFADVPTGKKTKTSVKASDLVNGIRTLELTDVRAAVDGDKKPDMTADIVMKDGAAYRIGLKKDGKKRWITVAVTADGKDAEGAKKIREATSGWTYQIAEWRAGQVFKSSDDLFEDVKPAATAPIQPGAPKMSLPPGAGAGN